MDSLQSQGDCAVGEKRSEKACKGVTAKVTDGEENEKRNGNHRANLRVPLGRLVWEMETIVPVYVYN